MIYVFDLDGVICDTNGRDYSGATPFPNRIEAINLLYNEGHTILIDSARGSVTGESWQERTERQLREWGLLFHRVRTGVKFYGDVYIDDKAQHVTDWQTKTFARFDDTEGEE